MAVPYVAPPGQPNGGDAGARAAGYGDYSAYQQAVDQQRNSGASSGNTGASGLDTTSVLNSAKQVNQFYQDANKPVVASYEASKASLQQRYTDLLSSIKQNQGIAENRQTVTTNNELGKRGISGDSGVAQQEMTNALNPITSDYTQRATDTTNQENIDLSNIQNTIAQLQAGNPTAAVSTSTGIANSVLQNSQFQQTQAATQKQNDIENTLKQLQLSAGGNSDTRYVPIGNGLYDVLTGNIIKSGSNTTTKDIYE